MSNVIKYDLFELEHALPTMAQKMLDWAFEVVMEQAQLMKGLAQVYVLVDTGSLRDSIRIERGGEGGTFKMVRVRAGGYVTNPRTGRLVDYATFVEKKQPFMQQAWDEVKNQISDLIQRKVTRELLAQHM